jgi:xylan 1,4-beta-xylosidase
VLNAFRMFGLLGMARVNASSSGAVPSVEVVRDGVRGRPDINVIAARKEHEVEILVWNYHDDDLPAAASQIELTVRGLPVKATRALAEHFRIDSSHSNAFTAWKEMGSLQTPDASQYVQLEHAGQLQLLTSPVWEPITQGTAHLRFALPRQGLSLIRIASE